jgi:hypothetical protein
MGHDEPSTTGSTGEIVAGALLGALVGAAALFAAILSGGAGHGDYFAARALFPIPAILADGSIGAISLVLALIQFPLYGSLVAFCCKRRSFGLILGLGAFHTLAAITVFAGPM